MVWAVMVVISTHVLYLEKTIYSCFSFCKSHPSPNNSHPPPYLQSFATFVDIQARIEARSKTLRVLPRMRRRGDLRTATPASMVISIVAFPFSCMNLYVAKVVCKICILMMCM